MDYLRLATAFKSLDGGIWDYDIEAGLFTCDRRFYEILGIAERAMPIRSIQAFGNHIHPEDSERARNIDIGKMADLLERDEVFHVDFRIIRPVHEIRWIRSIACVAQESKSAHRKIVGCVADITEFRHTESTPMLSSLRLTKNETECLRWVGLGKTASESGIILGKSSRTVEFHLNNAVRKLGVVNKSHAVAIAIRSGLI
jgi:DNA-binding CsgD family transcriptional regulator